MKDAFKAADFDLAVMALILSGPLPKADRSRDQPHLTRTLSCSGCVRGMALAIAAR
jgi:hypothetical protein